jgi:hypothetical protein
VAFELWTLLGSSPSFSCGDCGYSLHHLAVSFCVDFVAWPVSNELFSHIYFNINRPIEFSVKLEDVHSQGPVL